jgi:ribosomal-protein-serine acetyltransferase
MEGTDTAGHSGALEPPRLTAALVEFILHVDANTEIRPLRLEDVEILYELTKRNREHLTPWMSWMDRVLDASDVESFIRGAEREAREHTSFKAGIWQAGSLIGVIDLHEIDWLNSHARIGYWLDKAATGKGIMTRAVQLLTEYAFEALDLHRVEIHVATENHRSRHIPERLGFTLEGTLREVQLLHGRFHDHALYALLKDA